MKRILPAFGLGFLASCFQIYLLREFAAHFYGNEMTYGIVLGSWLLWGGLGSLFASRRRFPVSRFAPLLLTVVGVFPLCLAALRLSRFPLHLLPGEITGLSLILPFALGLSFLVNFPLGMLFVLAVKADDGNLTRVWIGESLGAAIGGLVVSLGLVPFVSNWQGAALAGAAVVLVAATMFSPRAKPLGAAVAVALLAVLWILDVPTQRLFWKPFPLLAAKDTPYGKLQVIRFREQVSLYSNGLPMFSTGDTASAEESIHFALLQGRDPHRALLIGGAAGGGLAEALKYPELSIDYVELDPDIIRMSVAYLPKAYLLALAEEDRVHIFIRDGRSFLASSRGPYDAIIIALPEPANAEVNRFYTREFFELARSRLSERGVLSFRVPSSESYISPERQRFLGTLFRTLSGVFDRVEVVPGETNVFLASRAPLTIDAATLSARVEAMGLKNVYVRREILQSRLGPLRAELLRAKLSELPAGLNTDLRPVSYFFDSVLWNSQFRNAESRLLTGLSRVPAGLLLGVPWVAILAVLLPLRRKTRGSPLLPLVFLGFTQIVAEIMVLIRFETLYGSVYGRLALLLASFMAGLFIGAAISRRGGHSPLGRPVPVQLGIIAWLGAFLLVLGLRLPEVLFYVFLLSLGFLGGNQFIICNRLYLRTRSDYGLGYGLDLLGSFAGALAASSIFIPLAGLSGLAIFLAALNILVLGFMLGGPPA